MKVGVLALQGAFNLHIQALERLDVEAIEVKSPENLNSVEALIIPGGESTTMSFLIESSGIFDALRKSSDNGMPILGTCAGMILLSSKITDGSRGSNNYPITNSCSLYKNFTLFTFGKTF